MSHRPHRSHIHGPHRPHRSHWHPYFHHPDLHRAWGAVHWPWATHRSRGPRSPAPTHGVEPGAVAESHASAATPHLSAAATTSFNLEWENNSFEERTMLCNFIGLRMASGVV